MTPIQIVTLSAGLALVLGTYWALTGFMVIASAQRVLEAGVHISPVRMLILRSWLMRGYIGDFLYNASVGTLTFGAAPRELMYSSRIQRYVDRASGERLRTAIEEADFLNAAVPEHIKRVDAARIRLANEGDQYG